MNLKSSPVELKLMNNAEDQQTRSFSVTIFTSSFLSSPSFPLVPSFRSFEDSSLLLS